MAVEAVGGLWTGSLALLADAAHMLTDAGGLALALFAIRFAERPRTPRNTFGYVRTEVLSALANAVVLLLLTVYILYEAYQRFLSPPQIVGGPMLVSLLAQTASYGNVAAAGLAATPSLEALTVMPFILRGVSLLGIGSAGTARDIRDDIWALLADEWKPVQLDAICTREATLAELPDVFATMLAGGSLGRTVVRLD